MENIMRGMLGIFVLLVVTALFSSNRKQIDWKLVAGGLVLQVLLGMAFFWGGPVTAAVINPIAEAFARISDFSDAGARMLFGTLTDNAKMEEVLGRNNGYLFAFRVLPTIIFFSALTSVLYYFGVLQRIVFVFAWIMKRLMRMSGAEGLGAASEVFLGQTESQLMIKPFLPQMTRSEIHALMVSGMATIAGGVMAAYINMLGGSDPVAKVEVARQLLCASLMNAPAAIVIAKMLVPETQTVNEDLHVPREKLGSNLFDALAEGTTSGLHLALNVGAMLVAFVAFIALLNGLLGWVGTAGNGDWSINGWVKSVSGGVFTELSLGAIFGTLFAPVAWLIGVDWADALRAGQLLGTKLTINEFVAYDILGKMKGVLEPKTVFLQTFALCGFANFGSVGIQIGGITALAPNQRETLVKLGGRALFGGTVACLLTASLAGMFFRG